jgi:hypothetical protein
MTRGAEYPSVSRVTIGDSLRFHDFMTRLAAELDRFGVMKGLVGANRTQARIDQTTGKENDERVAMSRLVEIDIRPPGARSFAILFYAFPLAKHPHRNQNHPDKKNRREDHVNKYAEIRISSAGSGLNEKEEAHRERCDGNKKTASDADLVINIPREFGIYHSLYLFNEPSGRLKIDA